MTFGSGGACEHAEPASDEKLLTEQSLRARTRHGGRRVRRLLRTACLSGAAVLQLRPRTVPAVVAADGPAELVGEERVGDVELSQLAVVVQRRIAVVPLVLVLPD